MRILGMMLAAGLALLGCDDQAAEPALQADGAGQQAPADGGLDAAADAGAPDLALDAQPDLAVDQAVDMAVPDADIVAEQPREAAPPRAYSLGECPVLNYGTTPEAAENADFMSGPDRRRFHLIVPSSYDGQTPLPVVFGWHYLAGDSEGMIREGDLVSAVEQQNFIVVAFDRAVLENGANRFLFSWPFGEPWGQEDEIRFFDDVLSCVDQQLNIDRQRLYGVGVSAGALWLTHLMNTDRVDHFAAVGVLSGGLAQRGTALQMAFTPRPHKFPAMVLWGGERDRLGIDFHDASLRLQAALLADHHFVVSCMHESGHGLPPIRTPEGVTRFIMLWRFLLDHRFGLDPGWSPYLDAGALPEEFESWCQIAAP
ncbi:MAG: hypothetical protein KC613_19670 [Myxococcales bacterium]|nr:hypothetical protein [Myxococcales bacterium]